MEPCELLIVFSSLLVALLVGANCASNAIGTSVGSSILSYRKAALLASVFMLLGAVISGQGVTETIGSELMPNSHVNEKYVVLATLISALLLVIVATYLSIPIAMNHAVVGALLGIILVGDLIDYVNLLRVGEILFMWFLTPIISIILSILIYQNLVISLSHRLNLETHSSLFMLFVVVVSAFLSYTIGANNVGNAAGPLLGSKTIRGNFTAAYIVGVVMGVGAILFSGKVVNTISCGILSMEPMMAFTAQLAAAIEIYILTMLSIPVSSTQAVVGGIIGVGLTKGIKTVNVHTIFHIFFGWILTPITTGLLGAVFYLLLINI